MLCISTQASHRFFADWNGHTFSINIKICGFGGKVTQTLIHMSL